MQPLRLAVFTALKTYFRMGHTTAVAEGWRELRRHPAVIEDLVHLGHLFEPDMDPQTGRILPSDELTARAARKALVLQLLARAEITHDELNHIRQTGGTSHETLLDDDDGAGGAGDDLGTE